MLLGRAWQRRRLERIFRFRHERLLRDLDRHASGPAQPLRVLITGASGLIGGALTAFLQTGGHEVVRLVRRPPSVLVSASAVGYYEDVEGTVDESAPAGDGFLAEVTAAWDRPPNRRGRRRRGRQRPAADKLGRSG